MIASMQGRAMGVEHAVLFRAYDLQAPPPLLDDLAAGARRAHRLLRVQDRAAVAAGAA